MVYTNLYIIFEVLLDSFSQYFKARCFQRCERQKRKPLSRLDIFRSFLLLLIIFRYSLLSAITVLSISELDPLFSFFYYSESLSFIIFNTFSFPLELDILLDIFLIFNVKSFRSSLASILLLNDIYQTSSSLIMLQLAAGMLTLMWFYDVRFFNILIYYKYCQILIISIEIISV